ncbi:TRP-domain-containing protein [Tothia fuscella]|uniref:TRP-domain-containing protein n=1 Tax=Tothia fuscella TaxID=1048955 RepID=A0A9P4NG47_9PEZI|nr:TRP-domain-containing protein [Tothia fuscella]
MKNSSFAASKFRVTFTANNDTVNFDIDGISQVTTNVVLDIEVLGYGYTIAHPTIDPCKEKKLAGICPMNAAPIQIKSNFPVDADSVKKIPTPIYYIPDLDLKVRVWINSTDTGNPIACVEADLGNGKTVHQKSVAWTIALIVLLGLVASAIISGLGHSNTATHLASNALSLFSYFQAQAFVGLTSVATPPIVRAWTQNFQWSMGIIRVKFLQQVATWYQRATGGKPSTYLSTLSTTSVHVQKRSNTMQNAVENMNFVNVKGIERAGFLENIEVTNIFLTSYIFFLVFMLFTAIGVLIFKHGCELLIRWRKMRPERFLDFRKGWTVMLKGILFRIVLITFPQMVILCFWEFTRRDSTAEVVIAVTTVTSMIIALSLASFKVWQYGRRSIKLHHNPAYILYSDLKCLNKWGFLYVQFKATKYFFIIPLLLYTFVKGLFIALGQESGVTQAVAFLVLDLSVLIAISVIRPYMNKKTNGLNIAIAAINFVDALLLFFFTGKLGVPALAIGVMGVFFFLLNVIFAIVIIILVLWTSISAILSKNPESQYQPMQDDRGSFLKSQSNLNTELDALGVTARGGRSGRMPLDDDGHGRESMGMQHLGMRNTGSKDSLSLEKGRFEGMRDGDRMSDVTTGSLRNSRSKLLRSPSPMHGNGVERRVGFERTASPLPRTQSPAVNWQKGVGY